MSLPTPPSSYTGVNVEGYWHNAGLWHLHANGKDYKQYTDSLGLPIATGLDIETSSEVSFSAALNNIETFLVGEGFSASEVDAAKSFTYTLYKNIGWVDGSGNIVEMSGALAMELVVAYLESQTGITTEFKESFRQTLDKTTQMICGCCKEINFSSNEFADKMSTIAAGSTDSAALAQTTASVFVASRQYHLPIKGPKPAPDGPQQTIWRDLADASGGALGAAGGGGVGGVIEAVGGSWLYDKLEYAWSNR